MSVSSMDSSPVAGDLQTKYQKLASEYAKMRAQVTVLKKAVLDEQAKNSELTESSKIKDLAIRKSEQEMDSLNFRNHQLTKRVTVLQEELEILQNKKRNKGKSSSSSNFNDDMRNNVFDEELQKKIIENAELINSLDEQKNNFCREQMELSNKLEICEHEYNELKKSILAINENHKSELSRQVGEQKKLKQIITSKNEEIDKLKLEIKKMYNLKTSERIYYQSVLIKLRDDNCRNSFNKILSCVRLSHFLNNLSQFYSSFTRAFPNLSNFNPDVQNLQFSTETLIKMYNEFVNNLRLENFDCFFETDFQNLHNNLHTFVKSVFQISNCFGENLSSPMADVFKKLAELWQNLSKLFEISSCDRDIGLSRILQLLALIKEEVAKLGKHMVSAGDANIITEMSSNLNDIITTLRDNLKIFENLFIINSNNNNNNKQAEIQQDKEFWKQELDLLKLSHSKKVKELEEQIASLSGATTPQSTGSANLTMSPTHLVQNTNEFGSISAPLLLTLESEGYESQVKKYFTSRTSSLVCDRQQAESKVTTLQSECELLHKRLEHSLESNTVLELSRQQAQETISRLQEELTTTATNYEIQLSSISEHIVHMNDKVAAQQEHIEQLTYLLENKDKKSKK